MVVFRCNYDSSPPGQNKPPHPIGAYPTLRRTPVFGIFKRGGKVYLEIAPDGAKAKLQTIIRGRVDPDSIIHSDGWHGYNGLVDLG